MFKNRNVQIAIGVVLLVVIGLGGFYAVAGQSKAKPEEKQSTEVVVQQVKPEEIGLTVEASPDKKKIRFAIAKAGGIKTIEYELIYEADLPPSEQLEGGEDRVTRQVAGEAKIPSGESSYESEWLDLGSCSRNVCKYDQGVEKVELLLKIVKDDNKVLQVEKSLEM